MPEKYSKSPQKCDAAMPLSETRQAVYSKPYPPVTSYQLVELQLQVLLLDVDAPIRAVGLVDVPLTICSGLLWFVQLCSNKVGHMGVTFSQRESEAQTS